jgi:hypothetical protein
VVPACNLSYSRDRRIKLVLGQPGLQEKILSQKQNTNKRVGDVPQVVEHLHVQGTGFNPQSGLYSKHFFFLLYWGLNSGP